MRRHLSARRIDHRSPSTTWYFLGPTSGLEEPAKTIVPPLPYADSLMLTRGVLRAAVPPQADVPVVLRVSGGTSILTELSNEGLTVDLEDALRVNAAAVTLSIFVGAEGERESLLNLAKLIDFGHRYGVPVLAVTAVGKDMVRDARYLGLCCRIPAELGAHFVKTYYCDGFEQVVRDTPVPVFIAGGKKLPERYARSSRVGSFPVPMGLRPPAQRLGYLLVRVSGAVGRRLHPLRGHPL